MLKPLFMELTFLDLLLFAVSFSSLHVFATKSNFLIPNSLQSDGVYLRY